MPRTPLVVVGASAGGIDALQRFLPSLPGDLQAAVTIVLHRAPLDGDKLPQLLQKYANLPVRPVGSDTIQPGVVYVAPPGLHVRIVDDRFRSDAGPKENGARPSIDVLFRSAADRPDRKTVGVLLSGVLDDGTSGLAAIKTAGGFTIVQDPADASFGDMPRSAIAHVDVDVICGASEMGAHVVAALNDANRVSTGS